MKRFVLVVLSALLTLGSALALLGAGPLRAEAAPPPTTYGGTAGGTVANVDLTVGALSLAGVRLADSAAAVDSTSTPRSSAGSKNLAATVAGLGVAVDSNTQTAPPDHTTGSSSSLAGVSALGIGASGLTATDQARWAGDNACVTDELANAYVRTDGISVNPTIAGLGVPVLTTGAGSTRGINSLVGSGLNKAVRGTSTGAVTGVSVLGAIGIEIADTTLTATADGSGGAGTFGYTPNTISYTYRGTTRTLSAGASDTITLGTVAAGQQVVTLTANTPTSSGTGRAASSAVTVLTVAVTVKAPVTGSTQASVGVGLLPLRASASAPSGGVDCPPPAPVITAPGNGTTTNDATPQLSGTGTPGASVNVSLDGGAVATGVATVGTDGTWTWSPATALADGTHTVTATQTVNGAVSSPSGTRTFSIDSTPPAAPTITAPADGSLLTTSRPVVTGTAEAGSSVAVRVDGALVGTVTAASDGRFSLTVPSDLGDGSHTITARATDAAGNGSPAATVTVRIDTTAPATPTLTSPADGSAGRDLTPAISGTAEPGSTVRAYVDGSALTTTATAAADGTFSLTAPALTEGDHTVYVTATDRAGNVSDHSATHRFRVDRTSPAAPAITNPADGSTIADASPTVRGSGESGAVVTVSVDGAVAGGAVVSVGGTWSYAVTDELADGSHTVSAYQTDSAGNTSASTSVQFGVDTVAPAAPVITGPAAGSVARGPDVTLAGTGEAGASVTVQQVGGASYGPVTVDGSGTWRVAVTGLADGSYSFTARQTDPAGNLSPVSSTATFTVSSTGPNPPVITAPTSGSATAASTVRIAGTGAAGATVTVYSGTATVVGITTVGGDGTWSLTHTFADGTQSLYATQDRGDGPSAVSSTVIVTVDTSAPAAPAVTSPANGAVIADRTPTVSGTGEPGARVRVTIGTQTLPTVTVGGDGSWSVTGGTSLADGRYTISAVQTDAAGNDSPATQVGFEVLASAPPAPGLDTPADGAPVATNTPTLGGSGENGDSVLVRIDGTAVGSAPVSGGRWSLTLSTPLTEGSHQVSVVQRGRSGLLSDAADSAFTVDTVAPAAPVLTAPADNTASNAGSVTVRGTAEPGSTVTVSLNGGTVGTVVAGTDGTWSLTTGTLPEGSYTLTATATDAAGNTSVSAGGISLVIDRTAPGAPVLTTPSAGAVLADATPDLSGSGEPGAIVSVSVDGGAPVSTTVATDGSWSLTLSPALDDGAHTLSLLQTDRAGNVSVTRTTTITVDTQAPATPVITAPTDGAILTGPDVLVTGTGEPGAILTLRLDGSPRPVVRVQSDGTWSVPLSGLSDDGHTVTVTLTDAAGNVSSSASRSFEVSAEAPAAPVILSPADHGLIGDATPTVSGSGTSGAVVSVSVDGTAVGTARVTASAWSLDLPSRLTDGLHTLTATQSVGISTSGESRPVSFTVDTTAPAAPVVTAPTDGAVTSNLTPRISGTGENGAVVDVLVDGVSIGTAPAVTGGTWSLVPGSALSEGRHRITATQTDAAGNLSPASDPVTLTVDTQAPDAPVIIRPADGAVLNDPTPVVTGTGEPGAIVQLALDGGTPTATTVAGDGSWSVTLPALADGDHAVTATLTGANGLPATGTATSRFRVDTVSPAAPAITSPAAGATLNDPNPLIVGTGEPAALVTVREQSRVLGTARVDGQGGWNLVSADLAEGQHVLTASQTDAAGNPSSASSGRLLVIDLTAPSAPTIGSPTDGSSWPVGQPLPVTGRGEPGAQLSLVVDGTVLAPATVGSDGLWSVTLSNPAAGSHTVTATQTDPAGNVSRRSASVTFAVAADTRPGPAVITSPADRASTTDRTPRIAGTASAGAAVSVRVDGAALGTVTADSGGRWQVDETSTLGYGGHVLSVVQTVGGVDSTPATSRFTVLPPGGRLPAPTVTQPSGRYRSTPITTIGGAGEPGATVTVTLDGASSAAGTAVVGGNGQWTFPVSPALGAGSHTIRATQTIASLPDSDPTVVQVVVDTSAAPPVITSPQSGTTTGDNTPTVTGTAEAGAQVTVFVNGSGPRTTTASGTGAWSLTLPKQPDGPLTLTALQVDQAGNVSSRSTPVTVTVRTVALPVIIAPRTSVTTARPVVIGTGQPKAKITVTLTSGSTVVRVGPVTVGTDGRWLLVTPTLSGATWTTRASQTVTGTPTLLSNSTRFRIVGSNGSVTPVITSPKTRTTFKSPKVTIKGTGLTGTTIALVGNGSHFYGQAKVVKGVWTINTTMRLKSTTLAAVQISPDATERVSKTITLRVPSIK